MADYRFEEVGIVGLGYVGLPLAISMVEAGYNVVGVDIDETRITSLRKGNSYVTDIEDSTVASALKDGFEPTTEYTDLSDVDAVSICVPTPMRKTGRPDLSYVVNATESLAKVIPDGSTIILESTVYPGATEEHVAETVSANGREVGSDVFVAFSPERIDPGNEEYDATDIPKVLGGVTDACGDRATAYYSSIFDEIVRVDSATEAELVKLLENTFRAVNIGLINELAQVAHQLDVDIWSVIDAATTKPFGFMPFYPGPGLGGHCIPVDPMYLSWKASQQGLETRFINLADQINREMPDHVVSRITKILNNEGIPLSEASVLILGVAYKPDVSDTRESPAFDIVQMLREYSADVEYHDPYVPVLGINGKKYNSVDITAKQLENVDCCVILTDHSNIDFDKILSAVPIVFDTRNATEGNDAENIYRL